MKYNYLSTYFHSYSFYQIIYSTISSVFDFNFEGLWVRALLRGKFSRKILM